MLLISHAVAVCHASHQHNKWFHPVKYIVSREREEAPLPPLLNKLTQQSKNVA